MADPKAEKKDDTVRFRPTDEIRELESEWAELVGDLDKLAGARKLSQYRQRAYVKGLKQDITDLRTKKTKKAQAEARG